MKKNLTFIALAVSSALLVGCGEDKTTSTTTTVEDTTPSVETVVATPLREAEKTVVIEDTEAELDAALAEAEPVETSGFVAVEGTHYEVINTDLDVDLSNGMVISEFFSLGCPHCQNFEPMVQAWKHVIQQSGQPVSIHKVAVPGSERWNLDSAVYYTMTELGATSEQVTQMLALYQQEGKEFKVFPTMERIEVFFGEVGLDSEKAMAILNDTNRLNPLLSKANAEFNKTNSQGVPSFVVNGKYKLLFNGMEKETDILDTMVYLNNL